MENLVRKWMERDETGYAYLLDFYHRGARVCYSADDGIAIINDEMNLVYAAGKVSHVPELRNCLLAMVDDYEEGLKVHLEVPHFVDYFEVSQAIYLKNEPLNIAHDGISTRMLTMDDMPFVLENYHNHGAFEDHIRGRIEEGMIGGYIEGKLAGFAGIHQEGSIGLLEVIPEYRRRGLAEVLEATVINMQLERGCLPYCHVVKGNSASVALQKKLGLVFHEKPLYWLGY